MKEFEGNNCFKNARNIMFLFPTYYGIINRAKQLTDSIIDKFGGIPLFNAPVKSSKGRPDSKGCKKGKKKLTKRYKDLPKLTESEIYGVTANHYSKIFEMPYKSSVKKKLKICFPSSRNIQYTIADVYFPQLTTVNGTYEFLLNLIDVYQKGIFLFSEREKVLENTVLIDRLLHDFSPNALSFKSYSGRYKFLKDADSLVEFLDIINKNSIIFIQFENMFPCLEESKFNFNNNQCEKLLQQLHELNNTNVLVSSICLFVEDLSRRYLKSVMPNSSISRASEIMIMPNSEYFKNLDLVYCFSNNYHEQNDIKVSFQEILMECFRDNSNIQFEKNQGDELFIAFKQFKIPNHLIEFRIPVC